MPPKGAKKQVKKIQEEEVHHQQEEEEYDSEETLDESQHLQEEEELLEEEEHVDPIVKETLELIQEPKPKRGRPKGAQNKIQVVKAVKIPKERVKRPKPVVYVVENEDGSLEEIPENKVIKEDEKLTKRQTKAIQARELKEETEKKIGKAVKVTKAGTVDNRCIRARTPAQIAATARLVENNRLRRLKNTESKKAKTEELIKGSVEKVIKDKLADKTEVVKPVKKPPVKKQLDYSSDFC